MANMNSLTAEQINDLKVLAEFVELYCRKKHDAAERIHPLPGQLQGTPGKSRFLCRHCAELLEHGMAKRAACPLDPKPTCKSCHIHCYSKEYRQKVREIMAFSGKRMILKGRLDYLWHYYFKK